MITGSVWDLHGFWMHSSSLGVPCIYLFIASVVVLNCCRAISKIYSEIFEIKIPFRDLSHVFAVLKQ
jgi:hypothetical protein